MQTLGGAACRWALRILPPCCLLLGISLAAQAEPLTAPPPAEAKPAPVILRFLDQPAAAIPKAAKANGEWGVEITEPPGRQAIHALLARRVTVESGKATLGNLVQAISEVGAIQTVLDRTALEALNINQDTLLTIRGNGMTLAAMLRHAMRSFEPTLTMVVKDGTLTITTKESAQEQMVRAVYHVRDLATAKPKLPFIQHARADSLPRPSHSLTPLVELIEQVVEPASWDVEGGPGQLKAVGGELLVVTQTDAVQGRVAALLETLCAVHNSQQAQPGAVLPPRVAASDLQNAFVERVQKAMAQTVPLHFDGEQLGQVVSSLSKTTGLPIILDKVALDGINISEESLITADVQNVKLHRGLEIMLRDVDPTLTWTYQDEALVITLREEAWNDLAPVAYPVRDLIRPDPAGGMPPLTGVELCDMITAIVEPSYWDAEGGQGAVRYVEGCDVLVVAQADFVQVQIAELLDGVRSSRRKQRASHPDAKNSPAASVAATVAADTEPETSIVIYHLGPVSAQPLLRWLVSGPALNSRQDLAELTKSIVDGVGASHWPEKSTSIRCVGNQIVVRQTPAIHEKIGQLLTQLHVLEPQSNAAESSPRFGGFLGRSGSGGFGGFGGLGGGGFGGGGFNLDPMAPPTLPPLPLPESDKSILLGPEKK